MLKRSLSFTGKKRLIKVGQTPLEKHPLSASLEQNLTELQKIFDLCADVVFRKFTLNCEPPINAVAVFADTLIDVKSGSETILKVIMQETTSLPENVRITKSNAIQILNERLLTAMNTKITRDFLELADFVLTGRVAIVIDGSSSVLTCYVGGSPGRIIEEPITEPVVRGPRDGFVEDYKINLSLIRRRIKSSRLKVELLEVGAISKTVVALCYIKGIVEDSLIEEVKTRINRIRMDVVNGSGTIEEMITDQPLSLFPLVEYTERPDKVAGSLAEGKVAIFVDNTPMTLIAPTTFISLLQASEDYDNAFIYASFVRLIRVVSLHIALLLPAITVAIMTFHQEIIPDKLMGVVLTSRKELPFPIVVEVLFMEMFFEILREAGVRLPRTIGQSVSIVGGLVIGQASVNAGFVGYIAVIVVALTAVASFAIPNYAAGTAIRILRFGLIILASIMGGVGIMMGLMFILFYLCGVRSFGVPYLSPIAPLIPRDLKDTFIRVPWWAMLTRPTFTGTKELVRMDTNQGSTKPNKGKE
ncbi:MAG: spore germination protein [Desulfosporosinus sp.]|nr:spore germination protein [Desulfosporosinus sp.]